MQKQISSIILFIYKHHISGLPFFANFFFFLSLEHLERATIYKYEFNLKNSINLIRIKEKNEICIVSYPLKKRVMLTTDRNHFSLTLPKNKKDNEEVKKQNFYKKQKIKQIIVELALVCFQLKVVSLF